MPKVKESGSTMANSYNKTNPRPTNNLDYKELTCHYCGCKGHIQLDCLKKKKENAKKSSSTESQPTPNQTLPTKLKKQFSSALRNILHIWLD